MCCGNKVVKDYGPGGAASSTGWVVTYPDGKTEVKTTEIMARLAAARVPNASYAKA